MLQNRLFQVGISNMSKCLPRLPFQFQRVPTRIALRTRSLYTHRQARCCVFSSDLHIRGSGLPFSSVFALNPKCFKAPQQNVPILQLVRMFSTTDPVQGIFSKPVDNKPPDADLIYKGPLSAMVKMVKLFSLSTSGIALIILQIMFFSSESGAMKVLGGSMAAMLFLTPIALHWVCKSYTTQIYFNRATDTFTSYTVSFFLASIRQDFTPADVEIPGVRSLMASIVVKGKPLLIDPRAFTHPNHYSHLMGYDKLPDDITPEELKKAISEFSDEQKD